MWYASPLATVETILLDNPLPQNCLDKTARAGSGQEPHIIAERAIAKQCVANFASVNGFILCNIRIYMYNNTLSYFEKKF